MRARAGWGESERATAEQRLRTGAAHLGVALDEAACARLLAYLDLLRIWNARLNLVGEHDTEGLVARHLLDALAAAPLLRERVPGRRIADLGSGAGLPGVPLALLLRPRETVLVEPRRKRTSFLHAVQRRLPDAGLTIYQGRAEDLAAEVAAGDGAMRFSAVVSRAALKDAVLLPIAEALLDEGGLLVAYRGVEPPRSAGSPTAGLSPAQVVPYRLDDRHRPFQLHVWRRLRFT